MKELVVLSGKGGTGKTSVAAALAYLAGTSAVIADCDVDAANMHLLLNPNFEKKEDFYSGQLAQIDASLCEACGRCDAVCRFDAIQYQPGAFSVDPLACEGCAYCSLICPADAISMQSRYAGKLFVSSIKTGSTMVHAQLAIGAENSGKLVAAVKQKAVEIARELQCGLVITDGSPGIGCPVISSLSGASYVLFVSEPSLSGLHDLKRAIELVQRFRIPSGIIVNKYDIHEEITDTTIRFAQASGMDVLGKIPYDAVFTTAQREQKTIPEMGGDIAQTIREFWGQLNQILHLNLSK